MTYQEAMKTLNEAVYDAIRAGNAERKHVTALREMAADIDHLVDHGCTRQEMRDLKRAQKAVAQSGLTA